MSTDLGPELDAARREVAERGLVPEAVSHLNAVVTALPLDALAPVKQHLKRFFSDAAWTEVDDAALADVVGGGSGSGHAELAPGLTLVWEWVEDRFRLRVGRAGSDVEGVEGAVGDGDVVDPPEITDLEASFDGPVTPEPTPSPRTIRFATPPLHDGSSRSYDADGPAPPDARVARLLRDFDAVTNVLVGPDFVAVSLDRPNRWEALLAPLLAAVTEEFVGESTSDVGDPSAGAPTRTSAPVTRWFGIGGTRTDVTRPRHLDRAWSELGGLHPSRPRDLERLVAASEDREPARRQVAATLLAEGPRDVATEAWSRLLNDRSRAVRRSTVDAIVDTERADVRALLERALSDDDAWVRWKALKGIARIGVAPSRATVEARRDDPDFRVRLEAAAALRG